MEIQESKTDDISLLTLRGRLDGQTSTSAQERIVAIIDQGATRVVLNLGAVEYISSAGLRVFMTAARRLKAANGRLVFCELQEDTRELFEIAGLTELFSICSTQDDALKKIREN